jgi:tRNA-modifying protein YgfZ
MSDEAAEVAALREGAGLWVRAGWGVVRLSDKDRLAFLHKYSTQDVKALAPGAGAYACCLTVKGGMVADLWLLAREHDALVLLAPAAREALPAHLKKYAVFDKVKIEPAADLTIVSLWGPRAEAILGGLLGAPPHGPDLTHATLTWQGAEVVVARDAPAGVPGFDLIAPAAAAATLEQRLLEAGARRVSAAAVDVLRVQAGWPLFGVDLDERTLPLEAGLEAKAISFTKGCYIGQEVVARVAHRGHVNRLLSAFTLSALPERAPVAVVKDGKEVGTLTTLARSPTLGPIALGFVHRKHNEAGTTFDAGGAVATLATLPLG